MFCASKLSLFYVKMKDAVATTRQHIPRSPVTGPGAPGRKGLLEGSLRTQPALSTAELSPLQQPLLLGGEGLASVL